MAFFQEKNPCLSVFMFPALLLDSWLFLLDWMTNLLVDYWTVQIAHASMLHLIEDSGAICFRSFLPILSDLAGRVRSGFHCLRNRTQKNNLFYHSTLPLIIIHLEIAPNMLIFHKALKTWFCAWAWGPGWLLNCLLVVLMAVFYEFPDCSVFLFFNNCVFVCSCVCIYVNVVSCLESHICVE